MHIDIFFGGFGQVKDLTVRELDEDRFKNAPSWRLRLEMNGKEDIQYAKKEGASCDVTKRPPFSEEGTRFTFLNAFLSGNFPPNLKAAEIAPTYSGPSPATHEADSVRLLAYFRFRHFQPVRGEGRILHSLREDW
jgi:hypothetical protein